MQLGQSQGTTPDYDYYAAAKPAAQSGPTSAAAARGGWGTTNQFGSPAAATATYAHTATVAPQGGGITPLKVVRVLAPLGVAVVAGFFGLGQLGFINPPDITPPATLGGQSPTTDPAMQAVLADSLAEVRSDNPGMDVDGQVYGSAESGEVYVLITGDGRTDVDREMSDVGATQVVETGDATCAVVGDLGATCVRTSFTRSMVLLTMSASGTTSTPEAAAGLLAEAWD